MTETTFVPQVNIDDLTDAERESFELVHKQAFQYAYDGVLTSADEAEDFACFAAARCYDYPEADLSTEYVKWLHAYGAAHYSERGE